MAAGAAAASPRVSPASDCARLMAPERESSDELDKSAKKVAELASKCVDRSRSDYLYSMTPAQAYYGSAGIVMTWTAAGAGLGMGIGGAATGPAAPAGLIVGGVIGGSAGAIAGIVHASYRFESNYKKWRELQPKEALEEFVEFFKEEEELEACRDLVFDQTVMQRPVRDTCTPSHVFDYDSIKAYLKGKSGCCPLGRGVIKFSELRVDYFTTGQMYAAYGRVLSKHAEKFRASPQLEVGLSRLRADLNSQSVYHFKKENEALLALLKSNRIHPVEFSSRLADLTSVLYPSGR